MLSKSRRRTKVRDEEDETEEDDWEEDDWEEEK